MLDITRLITIGSSSAAARPRGPAAEGIGGFAEAFLPSIPASMARLRPVVVWTATRGCNLHCAHCPSDARTRPTSGELSTAEARAMIEDLARFGVKTLVFTGGNPLLRADLQELVACAAAVGLCPVLVTNGTLITPAVAAQLQRAGLEAVKIPGDGIGDASGQYRGKKGTFQLAMAGCRNAVEAGLQVTLRVPLARRHFSQLDATFDFLERDGISRVCFQHLLYAGRGNGVRDDLTHAQSRRALDLIWRRAQGLSRRPGVAISTAANYVDGIYLYLKLLKQDPLPAREALRELSRKGGGRRGSGVGIGHIDAEGNVHPDPTWQDHSFGSIRQRPFSQIWLDLSDPLMFGLKNRLPLLKGRCAACQWKPLCGGNMRSRAAMVHGDPWMPDPACYLTNDERRKETACPVEISLKESRRKEEAA